MSEYVDCAGHTHTHTHTHTCARVWDYQCDPGRRKQFKYGSSRQEMDIFENNTNNMNKQSNNKNKNKTRTRTKTRRKSRTKTKCRTRKIYKHICQTQISGVINAARTGTRGLARVDGKTAVTIAAHGRAMPDAGGTSFGRTVRATASVGCARHTHVRVVGRAPS